MKGRLKPHKAIRFALDIARCGNTHEIYIVLNVILIKFYLLCGLQNVD